MNRKTFKFTVISISTLIILFLITSNSIVLESVNFSVSIWKDNLFPTLFPFFITINILISYGFIEIVAKIFNKPFKKLFKLPGECSFVFICSLISGFPSGAKYTVSMVENNIINKYDAEKLLTFTHYSNPLFILGFIGGIIFNNKLIGFIILISHILSGIFIGIIFNYKNKYTDANIKRKEENNILPFGKIISNSIMDSLNTMFLLLGIVVLFSIFTSFLQSILCLNSFNKSILSGILEMTQGIKNISILDIDIYIKILFITFFISFGGFSVHMQVLSLISNYDIRYNKFFIARIMHAITACILVTILYYFTFLYYQ